MCVCVCVYVCVSVCPSIYLSVCLSVFLSVCFSVCLFVYHCIKYACSDHVPLGDACNISCNGSCWGRDSESCQKPCKTVILLYGMS